MDELWLGNPLVQRAIHKAGGPSNAVAVLEALHGIMTDLETRCPGVSFHDILQSAGREDASPEGQVAVARMLLKEGHAPQEVDRILGYEARHRLAAHLSGEGWTTAQVDHFVGPRNGGGVVALGIDRTPASVAAIVAAVQALQEKGLSLRKACQQVGLSRRTFYRYKNHEYKKPPADRQSLYGTRWKTIGAFAAEHGCVAASKEFSVTKGYASTCKRQYTERLAPA